MRCRVVLKTRLSKVVSKGFQRGSQNRARPKNLDPPRLRGWPRGGTGREEEDIEAVIWGGAEANTTQLNRRRARCPSTRTRVALLGNDENKPFVYINKNYVKVNS
ncbi:hypothetical protein O0L34_g7784 [Tuta absoluta]|nr:hypothetical protein O0L34_g7784 [Tuta absoluta]